tara:strand:+ start:5638 stop:5952 length:315 start_codon:yes stop_codon:yes gene_type:complete
MRLLDVDPLTKIRTFHDYDEATDTTIIHTEQDTSDITDLNKAQQNDGFDKRKDMWHAASIPIVVQMEWMTKFGVDLMNKDHMQGVKRLLNSSEYSHLRRNNFVL